MITLYSKDGLTQKAEIHKFTYSGVFMGECFISATISLPEPIDFADGDYCMYRGEKFILSYDPAKEKQARRGTHGEAFIYDSIKFNSLADELTRVEFLDVVLPDNGIHFTSQPNFSFYASSVQDLADRIQANLNRIYSGANAWTITVSPDFISPDKNISVSNIKVSEALQLANSEFGANYIIRGRTITIGTAGMAVGRVFGYGKGNGLYDIQQITNQDAAIITRLRAYGSTRNIPYRYYNKLKDDNGNPYISESLYIPNLMLPDFPRTQNDASKVYLDSDNISKYGIREGSIYFDQGDNEIYPSIEGMTAQQLADSGITVSLPLGDNGNINELLGADNPTDNGELPEEGEGEIAGQFTIYLKDLGFDLSEKDSDGQYKYAAADTMQINMRSGMCVGRTFDVIDNGITKDTSLGYTRFKVELNRFTDDSIDVAFPNSNYQIAAGDKFVILGISMPEVYVKAAAQRLLTSAQEYLSQNDSTKYTYTPKIDEIFMANHPELGEKLKEGDILNFTDTDLDIDASVIIQTLRINEGDKLIPTYEVTLSNDRIAGTIEKMQGSINTLMANATGITLDQVKSQIASYGLRYFLSKLNDDTANGNITFKKNVYGSNFGNETFTSGQFGSGFRTWIASNGQSYAEFDNLLVRRNMDVSRLTIDEIKSVGGQILVSLASMYILNVETLTDSYKCYFDTANGTIPNQFAVDDQAICRKFNGQNIKYYWRRVVSVGSDYVELSMTDKDGNGIPNNGDEIIQLGNRTDVDRQSAIIISAYGSDAPSIKQYAGINSYDLTGKEKTVISPNGNKFTGKFVIESTGEDVQAKFSLLQNEINLKVSQNDYNDLDERVGTAESNITQNANSITTLVEKTGVDDLGEDETLYSKIESTASEIRLEVGEKTTLDEVKSGIVINSDGVTAFGDTFTVTNTLIADKINADGIDIASGGFVVGKDENGNNKVTVRGSLELDWDGDDTKPVNRIAAVDRSSENEKTKVIITPQAIRSINNIIGNETFPQVVANGAASSSSITTDITDFVFANITLPVGRYYDLVIPAIRLDATVNNGTSGFLMFMDNTSTGDSIVLIERYAGIYPDPQSVSFNQSVTVNGLQPGIYRLRIRLIAIGSYAIASYSIPAGATYSLRPIVEATEIGNNGICSIFTTTNWFHATTDGFVVRMGGVGFRITTNGIQKSSNMNATTPTWTNM